MSFQHDSASPGANAAPAIDENQLVRHVQVALAASTRRHVLIIEDDDSARRLLSVRLRNAGFDPIEANDGETGLTLAGRDQPDLVLLDLRLPGIDGFGVLERLKREPATARIPVIAVTGSDELWLGARARVLRLNHLARLKIWAG